jgi:transposase
MDGAQELRDFVFSYIPAEQRVPKHHPLRMIRAILDDTLKRTSRECEEIYTARLSIAPEKLFRALLLQALFTVRNDRMLMEQLNYNLLFRWFVGLQIDDPIWDVPVFTHNRERLLLAEITPTLLTSVLEQAQAIRLLRNEQFTVDRILIKTWTQKCRSHKDKKKRAYPPPKD